MALNERKLFLLAYDIADRDRLVQVHRTVRQQGIPLQYSVFLVPVTSGALNALLGDLESIIDERWDDIRVYTLPSQLDVEHYGRQMLPEGVQVLGDDPITQNIERLVVSSQ